MQRIADLPALPDEGSMKFQEGTHLVTLTGFTNGIIRLGGV